MILLFYGVNGEAAKIEAAKRRAEKQEVRAAECYACRAAETVDAVEFMDDVPETERARLAALFGLETYPAAVKPRRGKAKTAPVGSADEEGSNGLTRREMDADLEAMGIEPDPTIGIEDLVALHDEAKTAK